MAVHNTEAESPVETRVGSHLALADSSEAVREDNPASPAELMAADFLPPPNWPTLPATLTELCLCLTEAVPSVESAGVVIFPPESLQPGERPTLDRAEVIGAAPVGAAVLRIESDLDEGPVVTACGSQSIVTSGDLSTDERWPRFGPAVADLQLHSAVAVPLRGISSVTAGVLQYLLSSAKRFRRPRDPPDHCGRGRGPHRHARRRDAGAIQTIARGNARGLGPGARRQSGGRRPRPLELHRGAGALSTIADGQPCARRPRSISSDDRRGGQTGSSPTFHLLAELVKEWLTRVGCCARR